MSAVTGNETDADKIARLSGKVHELTKSLEASEANCNRIIAASQRGDKVDVLQLEVQLANLEGQVKDLTRKESGYMKECHEVEQNLGTALGYPRYVDDQKNFPGTTEADGCCTGEHTPATIAMEAAQKIIALKAQVADLENMSIPQHVVDDLTSRLQEALDGQVSLFDLDYPPRASQGAPTHEVQDLITADTVNFWISRIEELTQANVNLDIRLNESETKIRRLTASSGVVDEAATHAVERHTNETRYRAQRISQLENILRWALRTINLSHETPIRGRDRDRANSAYNYAFPPQPENQYAVRSGRVSAGMDYNHRNEYTRDTARAYAEHVGMERDMGRVNNDALTAMAQRFIATPPRAETPRREWQHLDVGAMNRAIAEVAPATPVRPR